MSRRTLLGASAAATAGLLAGCSSNGSGGGGKSLSVLVSANSFLPTEQKKWFSDTAAAFKSQTGATVTFETFASSNEETTRLQTAVTSGQGPDIFGLGTTFTPVAYATGAFATLTDGDWTKMGGKDALVPADFGISGPDKQHQIGIPFASRPFVMVYNTKMLKAAGIKAPATTWDELAAQAKKLTKNGVYGLTVGYKDPFSPWKYMWQMAKQQGSPLVAGTKAQVDTPAVMKAYQTYFGWLTKDKIVGPGAVGHTDAQALAEFAQGKAAYLMWTTSQSKPTLDDSSVKGDFDYALMPAGFSSAASDPAYSILSGDNWAIADYSKSKDVAFELMKMLLSADSQVKYQQTFGDLPTNAKALQQVESANPGFKPMTEAAAKSEATPFTGGWSAFEVALANVVVQSVPDLTKGNVSDSALKQRLATAQQAAQQAIDAAAKS